MSYSDYRSAILSLAQCEAEGEDIESDIASVASGAGLEPANVRNDVTEAAELV